MKKGVLGLLPFLLVFLLSAASAQVIRFPTPTPSRTPTPTPSPSPTPEPKQMPCPAIAVQAAPGPQVRDGQPVSFLLNINGGDPRVQPTILWNITAGTIK